MLKFGDFKLKSGRRSPYFFNTGLFNTGRDLADLGYFYAKVFMEYNPDCDVIFGSAYKGIPIVTTMVIALSKYYYVNKPYCFNRKEIKKHGEGGELIGSQLKGNVVIVDDVITTGTTIRKSVKIIKQHKAKLSAVILSLDRQEKTSRDILSIQEIKKEFNCKVFSIITLNNLIDFLSENQNMSTNLATMKKYYERHIIYSSKIN